MQANHHRALLAGSAVLATALDAGGAPAQALVARCAQAPWASLLDPAFWAAHGAAFPCTTAWMLLACWPAGADHPRPRATRALGRLVGMVAAMPPACVAAAGLAARFGAAWPGPADALVYGGAMALLSMAGLAPWTLLAGRPGPVPTPSPTESTCHDHPTR